MKPEVFLILETMCVSTKTWHEMGVPDHTDLPHRHESVQLACTRQHCACAMGLAWMVMRLSLMSDNGRSASSTGWEESVERTSRPWMTLPKMVYMPSRCGCAAYVMKNWLPARLLRVVLG